MITVISPAFRHVLLFTAVTYCKSILNSNVGGSLCLQSNNHICRVITVKSAATYYNYDYQQVTQSTVKLGRSEEAIVINIRNPISVFFIYAFLICSVAPLKEFLETSTSPEYSNHNAY